MIRKLSALIAAWVSAWAVGARTADAQHTSIPDSGGCVSGNVWVLSYAESILDEVWPAATPRTIDVPASEPAAAPGPSRTASRTTRIGLSEAAPAATPQLAGIHTQAALLARVEHFPSPMVLLFVMLTLAFAISGRVPRRQNLDRRRGAVQ